MNTQLLPTVDTANEFVAELQPVDRPGLMTRILGLVEQVESEQRVDWIPFIFDLLAESTAEQQAGRRKPVIKAFDLTTDDYKTLLRKAKERMKARNSDEGAEERLREEQARIAEDYAAAEHLLLDPGLLHEVAQTVEALGHVGDTRNALSLYLALTSRLTDNPIHTVVKGAASTGKSHLVETALKLFPPDGYEMLTGASPRALLYDEDLNLKHRALVMVEAAGLTHPETAYIVRSLLSEGRVHYKTVRDQMPVELDLEGPTAFVTTTTKVRLDDELETRMLSLYSPDNPRYIRQALGAIARPYGTIRFPEPNLAPFEALQRWLQAAAECRVVVPYSDWLHERVPNSPARVLRDFKHLLTSIATVAILHQKQRNGDEDGRIVATVADYAMAYVLFNQTFRQAVAEGLTPVVRAHYRAVAELEEQKDFPITKAKVGRHLGKTKQAVSGSAGMDWLLGKGHVVNDSKNPNQYDLRCGEPLPDEVPPLPQPCEVAEMFPDLAKPEEWVHPVTGEKLGVTDVIEEVVVVDERVDDESSVPESGKAHVKRFVKTAHELHQKTGKAPKVAQVKAAMQDSYECHCPMCGEDFLVASGEKGVECPTCHETERLVASL